MSAKMPKFVALALVSIILILSTSIASPAYSDSNVEKNLTENKHQQPAAGKIGSPNGSLTSNPSLKRQFHRHTYIDLTYKLNDQIIHWPANSGFKYTADHDKKDESGQYMKSDSIAMAIHTGTHMDSPRHFHQNGSSVDMIPVETLYDIPVIVVDVSKKVSRDRKYSFTRTDFLDSAGESLVIPESVVLVYTGISESSQNMTSYYNPTDPKNMETMQIPGFSKEAAEFLVQQRVYGVGLDAPSADSSGQDKANGRVAHRTFNENGVYIIENVGPELKKLVNKQANLIISPLPIETASGSPIRLVAYICRDEEDTHNAHNSANVASSLNLITSLLLLLGAIAFII